MKASDVLVKALENEGVKYIFGIPGEENLDFLESLRHSDIQMINVRHETVAGYMAATVGRLTGKAGVCLSTLGPGAANLMPAAAYGTLGGWPLILITGQKAVKSNPQGRFQFIETDDMMQAVTKWTKTVYGADNIAWMTRNAFKIAEDERPGAVHLELPEDIAKEELEPHFIKPTHPKIPLANDTCLGHLAEEVLKAKRPLICVASGCNRRRTSVAVTRFICDTGLPFISTQLGKGVIDERLPGFIGNVSMTDKMIVTRAVDAADLIIMIGHDDFEKPPFRMRPGGPTVAHINYSDAIVDPEYYPHVEVVGNISDIMERLTPKIAGKKNAWDFSFFGKVKRTLDKTIMAWDHVEEFPMSAPKIVREVRKVLPEDGIVCLDNGIYKIWFARNYQACHSNSLLLDNALATMGAGLASAMAAKIVHPKRKVLCVCGDGGFMMHCQDLETAVRLKLDLVILIVRDDAFGMIKWKQANMGLPTYNLDFGNPDFVLFAEAFGAVGHRIHSAEQFAGTLAEALDSGGVHLIDCPVDYSQNSELLNRHYRDIASRLDLPED
ncbi:acetolactate synthase [Fulvitalea axinellae]|uniref:Acetolactate synthase n=1 Tax=Fulvitalea axinellae TaxID=1182444 RepID=A0AAU9CQ62_9BACT|nr:acetolactate synthase [Fulvitalea axinellae]